MFLGVFGFSAEHESYINFPVLFYDMSIFTTKLSIVTQFQQKLSKSFETYLINFIFVIPSNIIFGIKSMQSIKGGMLGIRKESVEVFEFDDYRPPLYFQQLSQEQRRKMSLFTHCCIA